METHASPPHSVKYLVRHLGNGAFTLFRREMHLAKTEVIDNLLQLARHSTILAIGVAAAAAGLFMVASSFGWLATWGFTRAGASPMLASFLGWATVGILIGAVGAFLAVQGFQRLRKQSMRPENTIETIAQIRNHGVAPSPAAKPRPAPAKKPTVAEARQQVNETAHELKADLRELTHKFDPHRIQEDVKHQIQAQPYRASAAAILAGVIGGIILTRKARHA